MSSGEPKEVTLERVGDKVDVRRLTGRKVTRILRHSAEHGFYVHDEGYYIPVRHLEYDRFIQTDYRKERS